MTKLVMPRVDRKLIAKKDYVRFNFATSRENISKAIEKIDKILK